MYRPYFPWTWYFRYKRKHVWRGITPMGCNMFTEVGLPIMQGYPPPPRISITQARKQERMIWYVGQYPFWSEQWVRYVLLLCCHSDYWGDTEGLSWSGMREPAVRDRYTIAATITAWKPHTRTHADNWGTSHSLFRGTDPRSRVLMCVCWMSSARCNNQTLECVIKQSFSERRLEGVIRSCRNDAKWVFKEPLVKLEANTTSQEQLNEFTTMTDRHHMHNLASINRI